MRPGKLARDGVKAAHPLDRDEKGLVAVKPAVDERGQLIAQVRLELFDVCALDGSPAAHVASPLRDLVFERRVGKGGHAVLTLIQMPRKVPSTTCHCWRCAASCDFPSLVMR